MKQGRNVFIVLTISWCLSGCLGGIWTGAKLVYDRHNVYKKISDYQLFVEFTNALFIDKKFKSEGCLLDIAVFNGDVLLAGHLPTADLVEEVQRRIKPIRGYRQVYNQMMLSDAPINSVQDSWITTKIRSQIFADDSIDPNAFKVITSDRIVYLMGNVQKDQANKVIAIARQTNDVERVVRIFKYYTYQK